jgi:hypothetical protein
MDGMTINHIVSIDHGSYVSWEFPIFDHPVLVFCGFLWSFQGPGPLEKPMQSRTA